MYVSFCVCVSCAVVYYVVVVFVVNVSLTAPTRPRHNHEPITLCVTFDDGLIRQYTLLLLMGDIDTTDEHYTGSHTYIVYI